MRIRSVSQNGILRAVAFAVLMAVFGSLVFAARGGDPVSEKAAATAAAQLNGERPKQGSPISEPTPQTPVQRALASTVSLHFDKTPLRDFAAAIAREQKINVLLDRDNLSAANIDEKIPISVDLEGVSLGAALELILEQSNLAYLTPQDNVLLIVPAGAARDRATTRVYDVRAFAPRLDEFADRGFNWDAVAILPRYVTPSYWDGSAGLGASTCFAGKLIVAQTEEVQRQVAELFSALDKLRRQQETTTGGDPILIGSDKGTKPDEKTRRELAARGDVHFAKTSLNELARWLQRRGIPAFVDHQTILPPINAWGAPNDPATEPVISFDATNVPIGWALDRMLDDCGLTYRFRNGIAFITDKNRAVQLKCCAVYPVGDLVAAQESDAAVGVDAAYDDLIRTIRSTVVPQSWFDFICGNGLNANEGVIVAGQGQIMAVPSAKALVCLQTPEVHEEIKQLLNHLRAGIPPAAQGASATGSSTVIRVYHFAKRKKDEDNLVDRYAAAIKTLIEPATWNGGSASMQIFPDRIVVRHTPAVQRRIQRLLEEMIGAPDIPNRFDRLENPNTSGGAL